MNRKHNPEKSFTVALEQIAKLLRSEIKANEEKLKKRKAKILSKSPPKGSLSNTVEQIAKLLRTTVTSCSKPLKKRTWTRKETKSQKIEPIPIEKPSKKRRAI